MTSKENLMLVAMEEANELSKELSKTMRFGRDNFHPDEPEKTNENNLLTEFYQLTAMIEHLQKIGELPEFSVEKIEEIKSSKIEKVYHYMNLTKELGFLND